MIDIVNEAINRKLKAMSFTNIITGKVESLKPLQIRVSNKIVIGQSFIEPMSLGLNDYSPNSALPLVVGETVQMVRYNNGQRFYVLGKTAAPEVIDYTQLRNIPKLVTAVEQPLQPCEEPIKDEIVLHKVAKTGKYDDLIDRLIKSDMGDLVVDSIKSKNRFSTTLQKGVYLYADGTYSNGTSAMKTYLCSKDMMECEPGELLHIATNYVSSQVGFVFYDENRNRVGAATTWTATATEGAKYFHVNIKKAANAETIELEDIEWFQIETGSKYTNYVPYKKYGYNSEETMGKIMVDDIKSKNLVNAIRPQEVTLSETYYFDEPLEPGTYTISVSKIVSGGTTGKYLFLLKDDEGNEFYTFLYDNKLVTTFTTKQKYTYLRVYSQDGYDNSVDITTTYTNIMLEKGSLKTAYVPYKKYGYDSVNSMGSILVNDISCKNWFDMYTKPIIKYASVTPAIVDGKIRVNCSTTYTDNQWIYTVFPIKDSHKLLGKTVTLNGKWTESAANKGRINLYFINDRGNAVQAITAVYTSGVKNTVTIPDTFPQNANQIGLLLYVTNNTTINAGDYVDYYNIQLEIGDKETSYVPYNKIMYNSNDSMGDIVVDDIRGKNIFDINEAVSIYNSAAKLEKGKDYLRVVTTKAGYSYARCDIRCLDLTKYAGKTLTIYHTYDNNITTGMTVRSQIYIGSETSRGTRVSGDLSYSTNKKYLLKVPSAINDSNRYLYISPLVSDSSVKSVVGDYVTLRELQIVVGTELSGYAPHKKYGYSSQESMGHIMVDKISNKNVFDFNQIKHLSHASCSYYYENNRIKVIASYDTTGLVYTIPILMDLRGLEGKEVTFSFKSVCGRSDGYSPNGMELFYHDGSARELINWWAPSGFTFRVKDDLGDKHFLSVTAFLNPSGYSVKAGEYMEYYDIQLEVGTEKTEYTEHMNLEGRYDITTGMEKPTNEYVDGKRVYVYRTNLGTMVNDTTKSFKTSVSSGYKMIRTVLNAINNGAPSQLLNLPFFNNANTYCAANTYRYDDTVGVAYTTVGTLWSSYSFYAELYYTKD